MKMLRKTPAAPALLALVLAGCSDVLGIGDRDFEGFYSYAGTVDDAAGDVVIGEVDITRQRFGLAQVSIDWSYLDNGEEVIHIQTDDPAEAEIDGNGNIRFDFEGDLITGDRTVHFRLEHDGRLRGRTMTGFWRLTTGLPTDDGGSFTARKN